MSANGNNSKRGNGITNGSIAPTTQVDDRPEWFPAVVEPEGTLEISDCPGGICPVPWAKKEEKVDNVNHPPHYTDGGKIECIEAIEAQLTPEEYRGYLRGNCAKYLWRCNNKGHTKQDLQKCQWYLNRLLLTYED